MSSGHPIALRLLRAHRYRIPRHGVVLARLWRVRLTTVQPSDPLTNPRVLYAVELDGLGSRAWRLVGRDESRAIEIWALLVRNTVTPCALSDVLEEL